MLRAQRPWVVLDGRVLQLQLPLRWPAHPPAGARHDRRAVPAGRRGDRGKTPASGAVCRVPLMHGGPAMIITTARLVGGPFDGKVDQGVLVDKLPELATW